MIDKVLPHCVVATRTERYLKFRADPIHRGDKQRAVVPVAQFEESAESADVRSHTPREGLPHERLDTTQGFFTCVDVYTGVAIRSHCLFLKLSA